MNRRTVQIEHLGAIFIYTYTSRRRRRRRRSDGPWDNARLEFGARNRNDNEADWGRGRAREDIIVTRLQRDAGELRAK